MIHCYLEVFFGYLLIERVIFILGLREYIFNFEGMELFDIYVIIFFEWVV